MVIQCNVILKFNKTNIYIYIYIYLNSVYLFVINVVSNFLSETEWNSFIFIFLENFQIKWIMLISLGKKYNNILNLTKLMIMN